MYSLSTDWMFQWRMWLNGIQFELHLELSMVLFVSKLLVEFMTLEVALYWSRWPLVLLAQYYSYWLALSQFQTRSLQTLCGDAKGWIWTFCMQSIEHWTIALPSGACLLLESNLLLGLGLLQLPKLLPEILLGFLPNLDMLKILRLLSLLFCLRK